MFENGMFDKKPEESPNMIHQLQFNLAPVPVTDNQSLMNYSAIVTQSCVR